MTRQTLTIDGNEAVATVAYKINEVIAIYPITPSSAMGEHADAWAASGEKNIWGMVPSVVEMQSEGGAAGAVHGALQTGSLTTTFTASQGLLLMIPNMYKIAGELTSTVFHIAARSLASNGLSIFGDHSDVMATRATGWAMLFANSVQEAMDFALIAQASTLEARLPFLHIMDGFRTSHEVNKIVEVSDEDIRHLIDDELVRAHRGRALTPDNPVIRGTAQNPDVYFQAREAGNSFYLATPTIVQQIMDKFAEQTGRRYHLFDYVGAPDAERVIIMMGSGCETVEETIRYLNQRGEKLGLLKVRLFRPFAVELLLAALPASVQAIAVLDRTKEPGSAGEPLYQDVVTAFHAVLLSRQEAIDAIKAAIRKSYGKRGEAIVQLNFTAVDTTLANLFEVTVPQAVTSKIELPPIVPIHAPDFVQKVTAPMLAAQGDLLPVSLLPIDGTWPSGTTQYEKRNIAQEAPIWEQDLCIQCGKCIFVCPHSVIRAKVADAETLATAPEGFKSLFGNYRL